LLLTTNGGGTQNTTVNKSPNMCKIGTGPINSVLFVTREDIEQLNATRSKQRDFQKKRK
jgi:hypothetical protein